MLMFRFQNGAAKEISIRIKPVGPRGPTGPDGIAPVLILSQQFPVL